MTAWLLCAGLVLSACNRSSASGPDDAGQADATAADAAADAALTDALAPGDASSETGSRADARAPISMRCDAMDILFVIDNSASMAEEQANLADSFPRLIEVLDAFDEGDLDYRVGVTTTSFDEQFFGWLTSPGEEGALLQTPTMKQPWLSRGDKNLEQEFSAIATVGIEGSGAEQPLRAARTALTDQLEEGGANEDFLRQDALLAIVMVTDEDDLSTEDASPTGQVIPTDDFVASFDRIKGHRMRWSTAVFAGDQVPFCDSAFGTAGFAGRLRDFVTHSGANATFESICDGELATPLEEALALFQQACMSFPVII